MYYIDKWILLGISIGSLISCTFSESYEEFLPFFATMFVISCFMQKKG